MLWQIIFLAAGILSLIYYSAICIALKKWDSTFSRFWLATGIVGIAGSALIRLYGITGLFCSHSEVVFRRFQNKKLSAHGFSLWHFFPSLLFSSTCFLIHFHYNTAFCFVNIFSATVSRPQDIPAQNNLGIIMDGSLPVSETAP